MDEDYWATIQKSFSVTRGIINLNNGGISPSPRIVTEALVRYIWEQEDATAYAMIPHGINNSAPAGRRAE
jgi:hypothetical protein